MLIARRNSMVVGGDFANPYVTDGLIAMWDGVWNAGPGKHVDDFSSWLPCVGNRALIRGAAPGTVTITDNHVSSYAPSGSSGIIFAVSDAIPYSVDGWTIEHVCTVVNAYRWTIACGSFGRGGLYIGSAFDYYAGKDHLFVTGLNAKIPRTYTVAASNNQIRGFMGGVSCGYFTLTLTNGSSLINLQSGTDKGTLESYCIRLYSRALTAAEVTANSAVDKARFNLPDA